MGKGTDPEVLAMIHLKISPPGISEIPILEILIFRFHVKLQGGVMFSKWYESVATWWFRDGSMILYQGMFTVYYVWYQISRLIHVSFQHTSKFCLACCESRGLVDMKVSRG